MPSFFSIRFCFVVFFFVFCLDYLALQALTCSVKTSRFETILPNLYFDKMNLDFSKFFLDFRKLKLCFTNTQTSIQNFVPILVIRGNTFATLRLCERKTNLCERLFCRFMKVFISLLPNLETN